MYVCMYVCVCERERERERERLKIPDMLFETFFDMGIYICVLSLTGCALSELKN